MLFRSYSLWAGKPHCAGGGQGAYEHETSDGSIEGNSGGNGGTNGSNGYPGGRVIVSSPSRGEGGSYGGGTGGSISNGENATYYGSGGGGGGRYKKPDDSTTFSYGGSGYQGIVYIRIPENQAA